MWDDNDFGTQHHYNSKESVFYILKSVFKIIIFSAVFILGLGSCAKTIMVPVIKEPETKVTKYVIATLEKEDKVILPVWDATIDNPEYPHSMTLTVSIEGKTQFLHLDIGTPNYTPANEDAAFCVSVDNPFTYITEETKNTEYTQYIIIEKDSKNSTYELSDIGTTIYQRFKCELYLQNVNFGETVNGKNSTIPSMKVGQ